MRPVYGAKVFNKYIIAHIFKDGDYFTPCSGILRLVRIFSTMKN